MGPRKKNRETIEVTTHAKQRLYDRFNKLCFGRADFKEILQDAFSMGIEDRIFESGAVRVIFGDMGIIAHVKADRYLIVTVVDMSKCNVEIAHINHGNRKGRGAKKKLIKLRAKADKRTNSQY